MYFSSETITDTSDDGKTNQSFKHNNLNDDMASFENKIVQFLQSLHFNSKSMEFVLSWILCFDVNINGTNNNENEFPSITRCITSTCVQFKTLITQHQDWFALRHMEIYIYTESNKEGNNPSI